jgi:hypothetical protein
VSDDIFDRALDRRDAVIQDQRRRIKALEEEVQNLRHEARIQAIRGINPLEKGADQ